MKCQTCGQEIYLPFQCPYCGGQFCSQHRLPENHACPKIEFAQSHRSDAPVEVIAPKKSSYQYSYSFGSQLRSNRGFYFSPKELKHIGIAGLLVIGIGFSIGVYGNMSGNFYPPWSIDMMAIFAAILTASFLVHEVAHKVMAQKRGMWAEFRLTLWGAILTFASVFLPFFKMIAPGAMMISGSPTKDGLLKISVAGPITNILFSTAILALVFTLPIPVAYAVVLLFAAYINSFIAVFNLIPFGVLDGYKIFRINKAVWAAAFVPSVILTLFCYWYLFA